jgi:alkylated DNA repair dioxygenase AlkB
MLPGLEIPRHFTLGHWQLQYQPGFLDPGSADELFAKLMSRDDWHQPEISIHGKQVPVPRLVAWEGDPGVSYGYSGLVHRTSGWQPELSNLRDKVQIFSGFDFNYALLNLYRDGQDAMGWHRDNEVELGQHPMVASISLGSEREFHLRAERGAPLHRVRLEHGSLLLMPGKVMHHLPRRKGVSDPRINISLRCVKLNANQNVNHY